MASRVYKLATPAVGVWYRLQVPQDTAALMFKNDSVYDFLLVFGGTLAPNFTDSPGGQANAFVNALEYPVVYVQKPGASSYEQALNAVGGFDGNLWYLAQDNTASLASTGLSSGRIVLAIMTYGPLDPVPPSGQAVTRQVDITSQNRDISIPMTPAFSFSAQLQLNTGADAGFFPNIVAVTNPSLDVGCIVYIYYAAVTTSAVAGAATFSVRLRFKDNGNPAVTLGTYDALFGMVGQAANVGDEWEHNPACGVFNVTLQRGSNLPANTGNIEVDIHCFGATVANFPVDATLMIDSDASSHIGSLPVAVPGIGGGVNVDVYTGIQPKY